MTQYTKTILMYAIIASAVLLCAGSASAWYTGYDYRIPVQINNSGGEIALAYQIDVPPTGVNNTSLRVVDDTTNLPIPHWCETVVGGNCTSLWFTPTTLPAGVWTNDTYYIYYGNTGVTDASDYDTTFTKTYNTSGLVLELHMDEGTGNSVTTDTSGQGNNGTLTNMNITGDDVSGWQGADGGQWGDRSDMVFAAGDHTRFDGVDDCITCGNDSSLYVNAGSTMAAWINFTGGASLECIIGMCGVGGADGYYLAIYQNDLRLHYAGHTAYTCAQTLNQIPSGWIHITGTYDGNECELYINGVQQTLGTDDHGAGSYTPTTNLTIGARGDCAANRFSGDIDEVRVYNRLLSEDEIARQYIRSKYHTPQPSTSFGDPEEPTPIPVPTSDMSGWQGVGQDSVVGFIGFASLIGICVVLFAVGGIIIGARTMVGEVSPVTAVGVAIAIAIGALLLIMMMDVTPSAMAPMESIIMENATNATGGT